jgi:chloride channel 3/4/5
MIWFNGFPYLDSKEDHIFNVPVSHAMTNKPIFLPATDFAVKDAQLLLDSNKFQGFPIVDNENAKTLIGFIGRTELQYAIDRARRQGLLSPDAKCRFTTHPHAGVSSLVAGGLDAPSTTGLASSASSSIIPTSPRSSGQHDSEPPRTFDDIAASAGVRAVDFSPYVDFAPLTVHPRLPLETVMEIFKKMGPRVILVEHRGKLTGLVTVKDCLKYQFKAEAQEHADENGNGGTTGESSLEQRLWGLIQLVVSKVNIFGHRRGASPRSHEASRQREPDRDWQRRPDRRETGDIIDGTEELVELEERDITSSR